MDKQQQQYLQTITDINEDLHAENMQESHNNTVSTSISTTDKCRVVQCVCIQ